MNNIEYFKSLIEIHNDVKKEINRTLIILLIEVSIYLLIIAGDVKEIDIGTFTFSNKLLIIQIFPLIYSCTGIYYFSKAHHRSQILKKLKKLVENSELKKMEILIPKTFFDLFDGNVLPGWGRLPLLFILIPVLIISLAPFYILFFSIQKQYSEIHSDDWSSYIPFILSIWLFLIILIVIQVTKIKKTDSTTV